jgi:hypothetical protein
VSRRGGEILIAGLLGFWFCIHVGASKLKQRSCIYVATAELSYASILLVLFRSKSAFILLWRIAQGRSWECLMTEQQQCHFLDTR